MAIFDSLIVKRGLAMIRAVPSGVLPANRCNGSVAGGIVVLTR